MEEQCLPSCGGRGAPSSSPSKPPCSHRPIRPARCEPSVTSVAVTARATRCLQPDARGSPYSPAPRTRFFLPLRPGVSEGSGCTSSEDRSRLPRRPPARKREADQATDGHLDGHSSDLLSRPLAPAHPAESRLSVTSQRIVSIAAGPGESPALGTCFRGPGWLPAWAGTRAGEGLVRCPCSRSASRGPGVSEAAWPWGTRSGWGVRTGH